MSEIKGVEEISIEELTEILRQQNEENTEEE